MCFHGSIKPVHDGQMRPVCPGDLANEVGFIKEVVEFHHSAKTLGCVFPMFLCFPIVHLNSRHTVYELTVGV